MNMNKLTICLLALPLALTTLACPTKIKPGEDEDAGTGTGGTTAASGGAAGSTAGGKGGSGGAGGGGGSKETGGVIETGGSVGTGGVVSTGGVSGTGGAVSTGGATGTGGAPSTGGVTGTGGVTTSTGGVSGTGGATSTGGVSGTGGAPVTCNPACASTQTCVGTQCLSNDGQSCSLASQCVSKACTPFYVDLDGDGYGAGQAMGFCGTAPPVGYATLNGDCCDTATNIAVAKLIHPGADFQKNAANICNITWDYDCSGMIETAGQLCASCTAYPDCQCVYGSYPASSCGMAISQDSCGTPSSATSSCEGGTGTYAGTLACK